MPKSPIHAGLAMALTPALALALALAASGTTVARAGGRSGLSKTDARAGVIDGFWRCIKGKRCNESKVFRGNTAINEWRRAKRKILQIKVLQTAMVTNVPARWRAKFKRRWGKYVQKLAAAGYRSAALQRLGLGKSIVTAKPRVALAFMSIKMERRGRVKTEHLFLVLWKVKHRWYVAYFEDSPRKITRFMISNKPR